MKAARLLEGRTDFVIEEVPEPEPRDGTVVVAVEAAFLPSDPIVGFRVGGIERTGYADLASEDYSEEVLPQAGGIRKYLNLSKAGLFGKLEEHRKIRVQRRLTTDELQPAAASGPGIFEYALPVTETHPLK